MTEPADTTAVPADTTGADTPSILIRQLQGAVKALQAAGAPQPGDLKASAAAAAPAGWLACDGAAVSRTTYADLFAAVGTTFGAGDGSTTFNVPDLRGRAPIGTGTGAGLTARSLGAAGGEETHKLTGAESGVAAHTHDRPTGGNDYLLTNGTPSTQGGGVNGDLTASSAVTGDVTGGAKDAANAHNNMPPFVAVTWMVKT